MPEYSNVPIGTSNPGCIVILVDQSWSMSDPFGGGRKDEQAARAVNSVIEEIIFACRAGDEIKDRCHVSVIGYGKEVSCVVDGMASEVAAAIVRTEKGKKLIPDGVGGVLEIEVEMPVWLESMAYNGTPMHEAFERAYDIVERWIAVRPDSFPPVVINITDGAASDPDSTAAAARKIINLGTTDGNILVFNIHIANSVYQAVLPHDTTQFNGDNLTEFLFDISSALPQPLIEAAKEVGLSAEPGARCFAYNADEALMIRLLQFGSTGLTQIRGALPQPLD